MATVPKESFRRWKEINKEDGHPIWGRWAAVVASALYPDENDLEKVRARVKRHALTQIKLASLLGVDPDTSGRSAQA